MKVSSKLGTYHIAEPHSIRYRPCHCCLSNGTAIFSCPESHGIRIQDRSGLICSSNGKERFFRLKRNLGEQYSMVEIRKRLGRSLPAKKQAVATVPRKHYRLRGTLPKQKKPHLRRLYPYYRYQLGAFQKHLQSSRRMHFLLREDLRHLDSYPRAALLLFTAYLSRDARNRKVTACALVQVSSGAKVVSDVPFVIPFSTAQRTAL